MSVSIAIFYGSTTCYTEMAAEKIQAEFKQYLPEGDPLACFDIAQTPVVNAENYDYLIFGIPTWDYGELQEDWENQWESIEQIDFTGKKVALYGLGDQVGYPDWFQDAMGFLWAKVVNLGATAVGLWPNLGYEFNESKALTPDDQSFVGLALDDENEFELTYDRIQQWCKQVAIEFGFLEPDA